MSTDLKTPDKMSLIERLRAPMPDFFKKLQRIGLVLAGIGAAVAAFNKLPDAVIKLPELITTIGGYCAFAGFVIAAICQTTVKTPTDHP